VLANMKQYAWPLAGVRPLTGRLLWLCSVSSLKPTDDRIGPISAELRIAQSVSVRLAGVLRTCRSCFRHTFVTRCGVAAF
jgi:hypothetical protein